MESVSEAIIAVGAIMIALTAIGATLLRLFRLAQRIDAAIGVDESGRTLSQRLGAVEQAVLPDGRTSLPARVDQIESDVQALSAEVLVIREVVTRKVRES